MADSLTGFSSDLLETAKEQSHFVFFDSVVPACVNDGEGMLELVLFVVVGRWQVLKDSLDEVLRLSFIQVSIVITIEINPDLVDQLCQEAVALELRRQLFRESVEFQEEPIVDQHLNVAWLALPSQ